MVLRKWQFVVGPESTSGLWGPQLTAPACGRGLSAEVHPLGLAPWILGPFHCSRPFLTLPFVSFCALVN